MFPTPVVGWPAPPGHLAASLRRLSFPQLRLVRDMPDERRHSEECRIRCACSHRGCNELVPERWHQHLVAPLIRSCHLTLDERGNVTLGHWDAPSRRLSVSAWATRATPDPCQRDMLAASKDDFGTAAHSEFSCPRWFQKPYHWWMGRRHLVRHECRQRVCDGSSDAWERGRWLTLPFVFALG